MANLGLSVRQLVEEDTESLLMLRAQFFADQFEKGQREKAENHEDWLQDSTPKLIRNKRATLIFIQQADRVIGYCYGLTRVMPNMENPVVCSVEEFLIEPASRGKAAGTLLFEAVKADFVSRGADRIQLRVLARNDQGHGFWASVGFEPYLTTYELAHWNRDVRQDHAASTACEVLRGPRRSSGDLV